MGDIERGQIDIVVVYKIDRLTRSLADFSKMVEPMYPTYSRKNGRKYCCA